MSLQMALLTLISSGGPRSGYDLNRDFEGILKFVWHAKPTQVYPELRRLAAEGLIREQAEGSRGRRPYEITEEGLRVLRDWLTTTSADHSQRNETVLRSFALWLVHPEEAQAFLREEMEYHRARLRGMRATKKGLDPGRPADRAALLGVEAGIRRLEAMVSWAEWAIDTVADWPADTGDALSGSGAG
ncbi:DNA-binding PadR family transcriptional regulator [Streptosporangium becharense]|uniref:DNA-binding PadR family transcriptional regulator n=1 Tax=Streptosporangium becharense TaxID=1816182 RepID=A0A7W9IB89_9ACTN|nr:PadR family transcriptional regulator [Streptosporangium becharense]MBB2914189.1 DNA-binding PadR family transcriptional regulator [Streptosporangium becharense]MBB5817216.1 DNA-binding PadR family transcriptional regulator [Streptosporangium becharense]